MARRNRVTPWGEIIADPARGLLTGNRGCLHDAKGEIRPGRFPIRRWIACALTFKGRIRQLMQPGHYTELFFLDEATALAAGHRPCFECRRADAHLFQVFWEDALGTGTTAPALDRTLHEARLDPRTRGKRTLTLPLRELPAGAMIAWPKPHAGTAAPKREAALVGPSWVRSWSPAGYGPAFARRDGMVEVLTPEPILRVLRAGYIPGLHPSAEA